MHLTICSDSNFASLKANYDDATTAQFSQIEVIDAAKFPIFFSGNFHEYFEISKIEPSETRILFICMSSVFARKFGYEIERFPFLQQLDFLEQKFDLVLIGKFTKIGEFQNFIPASYFSRDSLGSKILNLNFKLSKKLESSKKSRMLDLETARPVNDKRRFKLLKVTKSLFFKEEFETIKRNIFLAANFHVEQPFKVIALDLDNTLWGGVIGEDGIKNIRLGGHDHIGEYFQEFQQWLKDLKNKGFLLVILSKNDEDLAISTIENHPDMVLRKDDFVAFEINWEEKHKNIKKIAEKLSLNLDAFIFIDDNPIEQIKMRSNVPQVTTLEFPNDLFALHEKLNAEPRLYKPTSTDEDLKRTQMYRQESARKNFLVSKPALNSCDIATEIGLSTQFDEFREGNLPRAMQLLNRTNQFSLSGRKYTPDEFYDLLKEPNTEGFVVRASDNFGDYGIIATVIYQSNDKSLTVTEFSMSCRILGRTIEDRILKKLKSITINSDIKLVFRFKNTGRNTVMANFLSQNNLT